ncbi:sugar ABC transporter substrate-binding protein [Ruminococcus sp. AF37-6AT]|jgi:ribose transport system substrate-binding protein|nr:substrate-binding domain-containing protein [uncultured Blautia sp.]MBS6711127.1 substrate-binding domain-containing protein [Ruminococcus sp.]RGI65721.1 sugar ABC transporter substrate-binding protein [Ruminococcus sp. TM10-9AT]RGW20111.1 sugar ABC transporter substrate-binding protein [Ruminococcus sp. AF13-37]RGW21635.1 sugar ABC transporter substrate-binding protein [Ruminococcus sp. AF13-28]RHD95757.1 sugar ABC transporter substrate-binding protein [Ruminococcus sp. AM30-15AC]RHG57865
MKGHKKVFIMAVILIAASVVIFIGLLKPEATQTRKCSLIYIPKIRDDTNDFWTSVISGCRMAAEEYESELEIMAPDKEENVEEQNRLLRAAIEKKPDAILFSPSSMNASDELLKEAKDKGIRITYIDSYTKEDLQDLTVATDNVNAGRMMGEYARTLLDKDSKIAIVSHVKGVSTAVEREQGFREGLGDYAENIVETVYCNSLYEKSYELAQKLMEKYPDLEMIAGMNEYSAVGVGRAVSDAGVKDRIDVVGVDCSQEAINLMEMGVYKGIIVQKAFRMGYIGVEETIHMLNGDAVEKNIDSGCELVTPENMYDSDIERLIFPFG